MSLPWSLTLASAAVPGGLGGVCLLMMPHRADSQEQPLATAGDVLDVISGARMIDKGPSAAIARHTFEFRCESRAEVAFLEGFFDQQQGKAAPFWFPTWQWEFELTGYTCTTFTGQVWLNRWESLGFAEHFAASMGYRKMLIVRGDQHQAHTATAVTESVSPGIDLVDVANNGDGPAVTPMGAGPSRHDDTYRPLWLRYGRFDQDELIVEEANGDGAAIIRVALVDLPDEVPA